MTKRIALLATGGTIACRQTADGLTPALKAEELMDYVHVRLPRRVQDGFEQHPAGGVDEAGASRR